MLKFNETQLRAYLNKRGIVFQNTENKATLVARLIMDGKLVKFMNALLHVYL